MQSRILVVDDDKFIRRFLEELLTEAGFSVIQAENGREGVRLALETNPEVILLDLVMPGMDGLETIHRLRSLPQFKFVPIIVLTARSDWEKTVNPFHVGADDYLSKPIDGDGLVARIRGNLLKKQAMEILDRKSRDYQALFEITESVNSSLETVEILRKIVNRIARDLDDVDRCSISVVQEDERYGYVLASSDDPGVYGHRFDLEKYPEIREAMKTRKAIRIDDVTRDPLLEEVRAKLSGKAFNAILVLPVICRQKVIGAMVVRTSRSSSGITRDEEEICQLVANVSGSALKNARCFERLCEESAILKNTKGYLEKELRIKTIYEKLFQNALEGLAAINGRGEVVFANRKALQMVGFSREELCGTSFVSLLDFYSIRQVILHRRRADQEPARAVPFDVRVRKSNGEKRLISVVFNSLPVDGDLHVVAFRDVTDRRAMEGELKETRDILRQANERLRQMDRTRADFLNTATHELRTPVTIVNGYCNLLKEMGTDNLTPQQVEFLDEAIKSSDRLADLINNMLDLSKLEVGKMTMDIGRRNLCDVVETVRGEMAPLVEQSRLEMEVLVGPACQALFDEEKIRRVLTNLIGNAVKFTPAGGKIRMLLEDNGEHVRVCIEDTGKGIPPERLPDLFNEFTQVGQEDTARGSGLGLSICKKIIESHRGRIWAESKPGEGSCFSFTLPKSF